MLAADASGTSISAGYNNGVLTLSGADTVARYQQVLRRIVSHVDALIGNEEDLQKGLGIAGPEVASRSKLDPKTFFQMIDRVVSVAGEGSVAGQRADSDRGGGVQPVDSQGAPGEPSQAA